MKIVWRDGSGLCLFAKRLDEHGFHRPRSEGRVIRLSSAQLMALIDDIEAGILIADKGYDAHERVIERLEAAGTEPVVPSKSNRKRTGAYDEARCAARHLVESLFEKKRRYRAIATYSDKTAAAFIGAIQLAASVIWLN